MAAATPATTTSITSITRDAGSSRFGLGIGGTSSPGSRVYAPAGAYEHR